MTHARLPSASAAPVSAADPDPDATAELLVVAVLLLEQPLSTTMAAAATAMAPVTVAFIRIPTLPCVRFENISKRRSSIDSIEPDMLRQEVTGLKHFRRLRTVRKWHRPNRTTRRSVPRWL